MNDNKAPKRQVVNSDYFTDGGKHYRIVQTPIEYDDQGQRTGGGPKLILVSD